MSAQFNSYKATPEGGPPPTKVTLSTNVSTDAGEQDMVVRFTLAESNNVFFQDAPGHPGPKKAISYTRLVNSGGTDIVIKTPLSFGFGDVVISAWITAAVLSPGSSVPFQEQGAFIRIRPQEKKK